MKKILLLFVSVALVAIAQAQVTDTLRVLCIGNSFTYFSDSPAKLVEVARSQGHEIVMTALYEGGYTFNDHLHDLKSVRGVEQTGFDCAFLQDQSQMHARYAADPVRFALAKRDTEELADRIRMYSPDARIWLESTWSYTQGNCGGFGTLECFDSLLVQGTAWLAQAARTQVSPIGSAFAIVRQERPDIDLYHPDQKHQSDYGTYLKVCVNYLLIYGRPFSGKVSACGLDAEKCAYLQQVAERVVL